MDDVQPFVYDQTYVYLRICHAPDLTRAVDNPNRLTLLMVKFGIAYSLAERDSQYQPDNGYMMFCFQCYTRAEAEIVEQLLNYDLQNMIALGTRGYIDVAQLAEFLHMQPYSGLYEEYISIARKFCGFIVHAIKERVFPGKYLHFGQTFQVVKHVSQFEISASSSQALVNQGLSYNCRDVAYDMALAMGMCDP